MSAADVLILCHAKNHKYEFLKLYFSKKVKKIKTDITQPISIKGRFQIITSDLYYDSEQAFKNIYDLLAPGGLFMTKFGGVNAPIIKLSKRQKEKYDIPVDISKIIKSPMITSRFKVIYVCQQKLSSHAEGYIYTNKSNKTEFADDMSIPQCLIDVCSVFGVDIVKWIKHNHMKLVILQKI